MRIILHMRENGGSWSVIGEAMIDQSGPEVAKRRLLANRDRWIACGFIPEGAEYRLTMHE